MALRANEDFWDLGSLQLEKTRPGIPGFGATRLYYRARAGA